MPPVNEVVANALMPAVVFTRSPITNLVLVEGGGVDVEDAAVKKVVAGSEYNPELSLVKTE